MRLLVLAVAALSFLYLGIQSLSFQVETTSGRANLSITNAQPAFNITNETADIGMATLGHGLPLILAAAAVVFVAVLLWVVGR